MKGFGELKKWKDMTEKGIKVIAILLLFAQSIFAQKTANPLHHDKSGQGKTIRIKKNANTTRSDYSEKCITHILHKKDIEEGLTPNDSVFESVLHSEVEYLKSVRSKNGEDTLRIPVIVHIVHNGENVGTGANISRAQVLSQIEVLNNDFRRKFNTPGHNTHPDGVDTKIEFVLALRDENGKALTEPGINRVNGNQSYWEVDDIDRYLKPQTIWDAEKYFNMWVVNFGGNSSGLLGYAQFPSLSGLGGLNSNGGLSTTDGVVMKHQAFGTLGTVEDPYDGGRTATHEVGHWLGLRHIWGDGDCYEDDYCDDTPRASEPNYNCKKNNSCTKFSGNDMIENYMDYTPDGCMNVFTEDQKLRMRAVLNKCPRRKELLKSDVADKGSLPIALFTADKTEICENEIITFTDLSVNNPITWSWRFFDANTNQTIATFTNQNPKIRFNRIGAYGLSLTVSNGSGFDSIVDSNYIAVLSTSDIKTPYYEGFETFNTFENWILFNPDNDRTWHETNDASVSGDWSLRFDNYSLDDDPSGNLDAIFSPEIDLSNNPNLYLTFNMAYAQYDDEYSDTLAFYITDDCGESFYIIWKKGGEDLATAPDTLDSFEPNANQWVNERIYLGQYSSLGKVHIAIVNWSGWGNNLYIDDFELFTPSFSTAPQAFFWTPKDTVSVGAKVVFADYSGNFPTAWEWTFEGLNPGQSYLQTAEVIYDKAGTYDVSLKASNPAGTGVYSVSDYITVMPKPTVSIISTDQDNAICNGDSVLLIAKGALNYEWKDERGNLVSYNDSIYVKPTIDQEYSVIGKDRYGGINNEIVKIDVEDAPVIFLGNDTTININDQITLSVNSALKNVTWSDKSAANSLVFVASDYGIGTHQITVSAESNIGCVGGDTISIEVVNPTTLKKDDNHFISVYPNPSNGTLNIENNYSTPIEIVLYDQIGREVIRKDVSRKSAINLSGLSKGIYQLRFEGLANNQVLNKTIVIN